MARFKFYITQCSTIVFLSLYINYRKDFFISKKLFNFISLLCLICTVSVAFSPYRIFLVLGIINFVNVIFVIVIASDYVRNTSNFIFFEKFILLAGVVITSIMTAAFMKINLNDFLMVSSGIIETTDTLVRLWPKATYFYTGIFYVLGASILVSYSNFLVSSHKLLPLIIFLYSSFGFVLYFNKTAFISISFALLYCTFACRKYISVKCFYYCYLNQPDWHDVTFFLTGTSQ